MFIICIIMKLVSPIQWLARLIYGMTKHAPMVAHEQTTPLHESYIIFLSINATGMREQRRGETIIYPCQFFCCTTTTCCRF